MDITGNKYGYLTAVKHVRYDQKVRASIWLYRCDCGNEKELQARTVTAGRIKTCGKCQLGRKLKGERPAIGRAVRQLFARYIRRAIREKKRWTLSMEDFRQLIDSSCRLCGKAPIIQMKGSRLRYNNVVLVESTKEYTQENVACVCKKCDLMFGKIGISQGIDHHFEVNRYLLNK